MKKVLLVTVLVWLVLQFMPRVSAQQEESDSKTKQYTGLPWAYGFPASATPAEIAAALAPRGGRGGGGGGAAGGARGGGGRGGAAPAAPAEPAEDLDAIRHVPGSNLAFNLRQVGSNTSPADWFPEDHPKMPEVVAHGKRPAVNACGFCHYPNGKGRPNNAGPAGLPANYILQQLEDFTTGARTSWDKRKRNTTQMIDIAKALTPEDAKVAADYFASVKWSPYIKVVETQMVPKTTFAGGGGGLITPTEGAGAGMEPLGMRILETPVDVEQTEPLRNPRSGFIAYVPVGSLKKGEALVLGGGEGKTVACASCHGEGLKGTEKFPALAGRSPSYLARQLYDFQHLTRVGPGSLLMRPVVQNLSEEDILNITAYVASLQP
jgi:cytochrome c553